MSVLKDIFPTPNINLVWGCRIPPQKKSGKEPIDPTLNKNKNILCSMNCGRYQQSYARTIIFISIMKESLVKRGGLTLIWNHTERLRWLVMGWCHNAETLQDVITPNIQGCHNFEKRLSCHIAEKAEMPVMPHTYSILTITYFGDTQ